MDQKNKEEYLFLIEKLDEIQWALDGLCNDIDCDKYMYRDLLKKKHKPILNHSFSCVDNLKRDKSAILRLLSQKKFNKYRYAKCPVCKKLLDKLDEKNMITSFVRQSETNKNYYEWEGFWVHGRCLPKMKTPSGWQKF